VEWKHLTLRTRIKHVVRRIICFAKSIQMHDIVIGLFLTGLSSVYRYELTTSTNLTPRQFLRESDGSCRVRLGLRCSCRNFVAQLGHPTS